MAGDDVTWKRADVLWRRIDGGVVLLGLHEGDEPTVLNGTGAALWAMLEQPIAQAALVAELAAMHGAPADVVAADVAPALRELESLRFVERG